LYDLESSFFLYTFRISTNKIKYDPHNQQTTFITSFQTGNNSVSSEIRFVHILQKLQMADSVLLYKHKIKKAHNLKLDSPNSKTATLDRRINNTN